MMVLRDAILIGDEEHLVLRGAIYGDTRGRFKDGEYVITSGIVDALPGGIFKTLHSTYSVEFAPGFEREIVSNANGS